MTGNSHGRLFKNIKTNSVRQVDFLQKFAPSKIDRKNYFPLFKLAPSFKRFGS